MEPSRAGLTAAKRGLFPDPTIISGGHFQGLLGSRKWPGCPSWWTRVWGHHQRPVWKSEGLGIPQLLEAVLQLLPLDTYVQSPAVVMEPVPSDRKNGLLAPVWTSYQSVLSRAGYEFSLGMVERFAFYERAKKAFAVVATGETALYGNLILKKGVLAPEDLC